MVRVNVAAKSVLNPHEAGATQAFMPVTELERLVNCCLLGEHQFYVEGAEVEARIRELIPVVPNEKVAEIAVRARRDLGLRHVPLLLLIGLAPRDCGPLIRDAANAILRTPKDAMDLVALYWRDGKKPLPGGFKRAIKDSFARWTDYQIAKYATLTNVSVRLRDLMFLVHPNPGERTELFRKLALRQGDPDRLKAPDTWESLLSVPGANKREVWESLLSGHKLGALALVRNLRNMEQVGVEPKLVRAALEKIKAADVWPWQALAAAREAPAYAHDLSELMIRSAGALPRLPGKTGVLVDVSASMDELLSKGTMTRIDAASGLAVVLREVCEDGQIATFSNSIVYLKNPPRGFILSETIRQSQPHHMTNLGGAVNYMETEFPELDRLIVLTDEQAQDQVAYNKPAYVINLASYERGVSWQGPVIRISGWSGGIVRYLTTEIVGAIVPSNDEE